MSNPATANVVHLHDICIDCDGGGIYPSGAPCKSCRGTGRVNKGDGIPPNASYAPLVPPADRGAPSRAS